MHDMGVDISLLRAFVAVAERRSITDAARALHLSQPALSRQIQSLEEQLGVVLFLRSARGMMLSPLGAELIHEAHATLDAAHAFLERARGTAGGDVRRITIGATPQSIEHLLPCPLGALTEAYPQAGITCVEGSNAALVEQLDAQAIDVAIAHLPAGREAYSRPLGRTQLYAVLSPDHPLAGRVSVDIDEVCEHPVLTLPRGYLTRSLLDGAVAHSGTRVSVALESASPRAIAALASVGLGVGIVSSAGLAVLADATAIPVLNAGGSIDAVISVGWTAPRQHSPAVRFLVDQLVAQGALGYVAA